MDLCLQSSFSNEETAQFKELVNDPTIDITTGDKYGFTPLHSLCLYFQDDNFIDIVHLLIEKGVDVNAKDHAGKTPLHCLSQFHNPIKFSLLFSVLVVLIENGAVINAKDLNGDTPLHVLACSLSYLSEHDHKNLMNYVRLFIKNGANVEEKNNAGITPADILRERGGLYIRNGLRSYCCIC